ncbi:cytidine deaminase [Alloalcanivorax gelatiniphagus]
MSNDPSTDPGTELSAEDAKLVTLARATRARARAEQGAAVRDLDGRTYAAASVRLEHLTLSALEVCVAMAVASASAGLEAAVVLLDGDPAEVEVDVRAAADFGGRDVPVLVGDPTGRLHTRTTTGVTAGR